jgi:hypothetical protein
MKGKRLIAKKGEEPKLIIRLGERSPFALRYNLPAKVEVLHDPREVSKPKPNKFRIKKAISFALAGLLLAFIVTGLIEIIKKIANSN